MHSVLLLFCAALPTAPPGLDNLDFSTGRLTGSAKAFPALCL